MGKEQIKGRREGGAGLLFLCAVRKQVYLYRDLEGKKDDAEKGNKGDGEERKEGKKEEGKARKVRKG